MTTVKQNGAKRFGPGKEILPKLAEWLEINADMLHDLWNEQEPDRDIASCMFVRKVLDEYTDRTFAINVDADGNTTIVEVVRQ